MDSLTSVSKGCFIVPAAKKGKRKLDAANYLPDKAPMTTQRWEMAQNIWDEMDQKITALQTQLTSKIFDDLLLFMKSSSDRKKKNETAQNCTGKRSEIPAAALITGVNMPDHTKLFDHLAKDIKLLLTPHAAILHAKHCTNMKMTMRCIGEQLILGKATVLLDTSCDGTAEGDMQKGGTFFWRSSTPLTVSLLEKWYDQVARCPPRGGAKTPKKKASNAPPVVIMLQDMEAFQPQVLHDLISMFSDVVDRIPVIFVFGVATSWKSVVDRLLPHSITVHLGLEKFYSPSASQHLTLIIDEILLTPDQPFKLSGRCMQLLLDIFLCHDFSVTNYLHILKFCVLEHFYQQPASIIAGWGVDDFGDKDIDISAIIDRIQALPSMQKYLNSLPSKKRQEVELDSIKMEEKIWQFLADIHDFHQCFFPVMRCLHALCRSLPRHPLGRQVRELYCMCDSGAVTDSAEYKHAKLLLQVSSRDQMVERLQACVKELKKISSPVQNTSVLLAYVSDAGLEIGMLVRDLMALTGGEEDEKDDSDDEDGEDPAKQPLEKVKYAYQLQERLKQRSEKKKISKMTRFEKLRMKALDVLDALFTKVLKPPRTLPLHEVFYFDSVSAIKRHAMAAPRSAIQTALSNPHYYLKTCLESVANGGIPPSTPEVCVAYKLHNECGRLINLYDWMEAFHTIVNAKDDEESTGCEEINEQTQARFIRAASELQFLGFIKPTKRKTDHVERVTWSNA